MTGDDLPALATALEKKPGVDSVAPFGASLHVSGRDRAALEAAIAPYRNDPRLAWKAIEPSLEDVFIGLMAQAQGQHAMSALVTARARAVSGAGSAP